MNNPESAAANEAQPPKENAHLPVDGQTDLRDYLQDQLIQALQRRLASEADIGSDRATSLIDLVRAGNLNSTSILNVLAEGDAAAAQ